MILKKELDVITTNYYMDDDLKHKPQVLSHGVQHLEDDKKQLRLGSAKL